MYIYLYTMQALNNLKVKPVSWQVRSRIRRSMLVKLSRLSWNRKTRSNNQRKQLKYWMIYQNVVKLKVNNWKNHQNKTTNQSNIYIGLFRLNESTVLNFIKEEDAYSSQVLDLMAELQASKETFHFISEKFRKSELPFEVMVKVQCIPNVDD